MYAFSCEYCLTSTVTVSRAPLLSHLYLTFIYLDKPFSLPCLDAVPAPSDLKVSEITSNSAQISWLPGNSNYSHTISINGRDVQVVKPGLCVHTLTGSNRCAS